MADGVRVTGLKPKIAGLRKYGIMAGDMKSAFADIAERGATLARARTPIRTGKLLGSTRSRAYSNRATVLQGNKGRVWYASYVNYGTRGRPGTRHLNKVDIPWKPYAMRRLAQQLESNRRKSGL